MKKIISSLFIVIGSLLAMNAQTVITENLPDGKRVILQKQSGETVAYGMEDISEMYFADLTATEVALKVKSVDDASIKVEAAPGSDCQSYEIVCYPSGLVAEADLLDYIKKNSTGLKTGVSEIDFIDLTSETEYTISALSYDAYGLTCDITSISATTKESSSSAEDPTIGGYLYTDGSWSKDLKSNKTAIGIIYSLTPTEKDKLNGFTHGYAVALNEIDSQIWTLEADEQESGATITSANDNDLNDRDGLTHSNYLLAKADLHPAASAAKNYGESPASTSGWYLPSTGQLVEMMQNLGGLSNDSFSRDASNNATWSAEGASAAVEKLNKCLAKVGEGKYTAWSSYVWTSSELSVMAAFYLYSYPGNGMALLTYYKDSKFAVRPVIAF